MVLIVKDLSSGLSLFEFKSQLSYLCYYLILGKFLKVSIIFFLKRDHKKKGRRIGFTGYLKMNM